jgi:hypothetical protein
LVNVGASGTPAGAAAVSVVASANDPANPIAMNPAFIAHSFEVVYRRKQL